MAPHLAAAARRSRELWLVILATLGCGANTPADAAASDVGAGTVNGSTLPGSGGSVVSSEQASTSTASGASSSGGASAAAQSRSEEAPGGGGTTSSVVSAPSMGGTSDSRRRSSSTIGSLVGGGPAKGGSSAKSAVGSKATGGSTASAGASSKASGGSSTNSGSTSNGSGECLDGPEMVVPSGYTLAWSDEFNQDGDPDASNWGYESGFVRNEEAQWYQPDNAWVEKGCLIIEGRRERKTNPNYKAGSSDWKTSRQYAEYTSTSLRTMSKRTWLYGRFEMRGRIKTQAGLWPAWWTLGEAKEWPSCGEIDIMEYYAGYMRANVACGTSTRWQAKWDSASWKVADFENKNWENEFHVWRMDWDDQNIVLYLDDKQFNTTKLSDMLNSDGSSPFKQPHYMILNLAIGGNNGGDASKTTFPTRFEVDYVRVFQKR